MNDLPKFYCVPSFLMCYVFSPSCSFHIDTYCCLCTNMLSEVLLFLSQYLTLCGDIQLMLAQNASNRAAHLEEFNYQTKEDQEILHSLHRESSCQGTQGGACSVAQRSARNVRVSSFLNVNVEHNPLYLCLKWFWNIL